MAIIILSALVTLAISFFAAGEFSDIAEMKGHQGRQYFWWCFLTGIVGWLMVIALPDRHGAQEQSTPSTDYLSDYLNAVDLMERGDYEAASEIFSALGNYEDSAERLAQLEILNQCSHYIGEFVCTVNGSKCLLTSDFAIYDNVCWEVEILNSEKIGFQSGNKRHCFFTDCPIEDLIVSEGLTVTDTWDGETLVASFENGNIIITASGPSVGGNDFYNRQYTKVE